MDIATLLANQKRLTLTLAIGLAVAGALCWTLMPRQEDPAFPARAALVLVPFPGADAPTVERLVLEPVERELAAVESIRKVDARARRDVAILDIQLRDSVYDVAPVWDEVEDALDRAAADFPDAAGPWTLDDDVISTVTALFAVTGSDDLLQLGDGADLLEARLREVPGVARVERYADAGEQVTVALDDAAARRLGLPPALLASQLQAHAAAVPGGSLARGGIVLGIDPGNQFTDVDDVRAFPVRVGEGIVELGAVADVRRSPTEPVAERMRWQGRTAVALGVVPARGIDVVRFGRDLREAVAATEAELAPLRVEQVIDQPARVDARLRDLGGSLLTGVVIVAAVLFVAMGLRLGGVVALVVPIVTLSSLALYAAAGGVLQQISIAGLVLSLGLLVDNGIVVAERVQWHVDRGVVGAEAARRTVSELALPLFSATGTTVASFVPLLLSRGAAGDFTRSIPQIVIVTLVVSLVVALTVTPAISAAVFRPRPPRPPSRWTGLLARGASLPARRPIAVVVVGVLLVGAAGAGLPGVERQFFPAGDRNQLIFEVELPEGSHLDRTEAAARALEAELLPRDDVTAVATFVGRGVPPFYYNLPRRPSSPQLAHLLVVTERPEQVEGVLRDGRRFADRELPGIRFVARPLEQGPPTTAPVELRLFGDDLEALWATAGLAHRELRRTPGTVDVRHDLAPGSPTLDLAVEDAALARAGLGRRDVAAAVLGRTRGLPAGELRGEAKPVPITVRSSEGELLPLERLEGLDVWSPERGPLPLAAVARTEVTWQPSTIRRIDGERVVSVAAQLDGSRGYGEVLDDVVGPMAEAAGAAGLRLEVGGEAEGSGDANSAIFLAAPVGAALLLGFLLAQFRSFRKVGIVLATVPLAATGVIPGLLLFDQPFGFTSMLGVFALVGIVVNNAIILIDFIDVRRAEGAALADAVAGAISVRLRPILLTTGTTVAGMLPLLFSSSTLWPPLASALISGLLASTVLTVGVVPSLYVLLFGGWRLPPLPAALRRSDRPMAAATAG